MDFLYQFKTKKKGKRDKVDHSFRTFLKKKI